MPKSYSNQKDRKDGLNFVKQNKTQLKKIINPELVEAVENENRISFRNKKDLDNIRKALWREYYKK